MISAVGTQGPGGAANYGVYYTIVDFTSGQILLQGGLQTDYGTSRTKVVGDITIEMGQDGRQIPNTYITSPYAGDVYYGYSDNMGRAFTYVGNISESNYTNYTHLSVPANVRTQIPLDVVSWYGYASFAIFKKA